ncbi:hypothetical protein GCM10010211_47380 [Streptomyces albospinus]|uniref:Uncharacterized protein n=1 Tax=Streptomyces albospinus TaxID=285515 RepID=A0ABQ2V9T9_9ACTN|nr:hypothetical protein GCM10010211_47380 [Streptomyces albospinus]
MIKKNNKAGCPNKLSWQPASLGRMTHRAAMPSATSIGPEHVLVQGQHVGKQGQQLRRVVQHLARQCRHRPGQRSDGGVLPMPVPAQIRAMGASARSMRRVSRATPPCGWRNAGIAAGNGHDC